MVPLSISRDDGFSQNFKRPRQDVEGTISEGCGVVLTRMKPREVEYNKIDINPSKENARMESAHRKYPPSRILKQFPVHRDIPIGCKNQNFGGSSSLTNRKLMVVSDGMELRESEQNMIGVNPSRENAMVDFSPRKYPPPRILKQFPVHRDIPIGCKNQNFGDSSSLTNRKLVVVSDGMELRESEQNMIGVNPSHENAMVEFSPRKYPPRKYPPPRILKQFPVHRDIPIGCKNQNFGDSSSLTNRKLMVVSDGMELRESEQNMIGVNPSHENAMVEFSPRKYPPRKYPPPRILKGFVVRRDFPVGCGNQKFDHHRDPPDGKLMGGDGMKSRENECNAIGVNLLNETVVMDIVRRKYPSPKILKQFAIQRDLRVGCKKKSFSHLSNSTNGKSLVDFEPLEATNEVDVYRNKVNINRNKVKKALQTFQDLYFKLMQEEDEKIVASKVQIKAAMLLRVQLKGICASKQLGPIPGVEVGDLFQWVTELNVIGLHCQFCSGIDYMKINGKAFATSIISSGRYYNDVEFSDVLIYSGHGGNPIISGKQVEDQKLERGNLALKNSMEAKTPVRVIHGFKISKSSAWIGLSGMRIFNKIYVYDGLYLVDRYWQERGQFGKLVFMFLLKRIVGQPRCAFRKMSEFKNSATEENGIFYENHKMAIMSKRRC